MKLWGGVLGPHMFPVWVATVLLTAAAVQALFLQNKRVSEISDGVTKAITKRLE